MRRYDIWIRFWSEPNSKGWIGYCLKPDDLWPIYSFLLYLIYSAETVVAIGQPNKALSKLTAKQQLMLSLSWSFTCLEAFITLYYTLGYIMCLCQLYLTPIYWGAVKAGELRLRGRKGETCMIVNESSVQ